MRQFILRSLAAILTVGGLAVLVFTDHSKRSWGQLWAIVAMTVVFGAYSAIGLNAADRVLATLLGAKPDRAEDPDGR